MTIVEKITNDIQVIVEALYEQERSRPEQLNFVFSYRIEISNFSAMPIQVHRRSWTMTDAFFNVEYIEGEGVVGEKPVIMPGESYSYISYCQLKTSFGSMKGYYTVIDDAGRSFKIDIPEFILAHPYAVQ